MAEQWKPVVGYEGFYEVSDLGRVRTVARRVATKGGAVRLVASRIRRLAMLRGYPAVNLSALGQARMRTVHVMALEAFVGPRPSPDMECCHNDGNRLNARLDNLRWGTKVENKADSFLHGTAVYGERVVGAKLTVEQVLRARSDQRAARVVAAEMGVNMCSIHRARSGKTWARALASVGVSDGH